MRQLQSIPITVSGSVHTRKQISSLNLVIHMYDGPPQKHFLVGCSLPFVRLAQHLTAQAMSASSVKPDVLRPGIVGMRESIFIRLQPRMA